MTSTLPGAPVGAWDVSLTHKDDGKSSTLPGALDVQFPDPHVTGINPGWGYSGHTINGASITGSDFRDVPMTVELHRGADTIGRDACVI